MFDYRRTLAELEPDITAAIQRVLHSGSLILGPETEAFEREFAAYAGARHCVGMASGTTALYIALAALDLTTGDEVITVANTCVPTAAAIRLTGATVAFADVRDDDLMMDTSRVAATITKRTRAVLPVHLWGQAADTTALRTLAEDRGIDIVEDCAQAHGTLIHGRHVGTAGKFGCFSFYPTKNIGAYGDAGAIVTDDDDLAARLKALRFFRYDGKTPPPDGGMNGRIDELQAAILRVKLAAYPEFLLRRRHHAALYDDHLASTPITLPARQAGVEASHHQYVVRVPQRDALREHLHALGIETAIHYQQPLHRMAPYRGDKSADTTLPVTEKATEEILSLPVHEALETDEVLSVAGAIDTFFKKKRS
jgi:dTDP-3-amino-2,3,6-trideoxy-4-keto-D-glucose/dTDP-3-amino-3,4,6-trideoxy-alpha-D-glucose/dTDP-2,6-dideoxy-D-kanosamine transaminase